MAIEKAQFRNTTSSHQGAVIFDQANKPHGISVAPGDTVWLSEDEQQMTANAPQDPHDNPFLPLHDVLDEERKPTGEKRPIFELEQTLRPITGGRPIGADATADPGAPAEPTGSAPTGESAPGEEVAKPDAPDLKAKAEAEAKEKAELEADAKTKAEHAAKAKANEGAGGKSTSPNAAAKPKAEPSG